MDRMSLIKSHAVYATANAMLTTVIDRRYNRTYRAEEGGSTTVMNVRRMINRSRLKLHFSM
jgi:hypothetical protein